MMDSAAKVMKGLAAAGQAVVDEAVKAAETAAASQPAAVAELDSRIEHPTLQHSLRQPHGRFRPRLRRARRTTTPPSEFIRGIGPLAAISLVVGSMIGSGIFIVSADIGRQVGPWGPGGLLLVWVVTGAMTVTGALAYAELAAMMPKAGGQYVFLREGLSPLAGFLYGWTLFAVIQTGTIAAVAVAFAKFLGVLVPAVSPTSSSRSASSACPAPPTRSSSASRRSGSWRSS